MNKSEIPLVKCLREAWSRMPGWDPLDLEDKVRAAVERHGLSPTAYVTFFVYNAKTDKIVLCRESICLGSIYWMFTSPDGGFLFNDRRRRDRGDSAYRDALGVTLFSYEELLDGLEAGTFRAYVMFPANEYQKGMDWLINELPEKYHKYISQGPGRRTLVEVHPDLSPLEFGVVYQFPRQATQQSYTLTLLLEKVRGRTMQRLFACELLWHGGESANLRSYQYEYVINGVGSILDFCAEKFRTGSAFGAFLAGVVPRTKAWSLDNGNLWPGATYKGGWLTTAIEDMFPGQAILRAIANNEPVTHLPQDVVDEYVPAFPKHKEALREIQRRCEESASAEA